MKIDFSVFGVEPKMLTFVLKVNGVIVAENGKQTTYSKNCINSGWVSQID